MTSAIVQKHFKSLGKLIYLAQKGPTDAASYQLAISGVLDQLSTGAAADVVPITVVGVPLISSVSQIATTLNGLNATAKGWVTTYLKQALAPDLGLSTNATPAQIGTALASLMTSSGESVAPSGSNGSNANGIAVYFASGFAITLPQNGSPTIPDAYITATPN